MAEQIKVVGLGGSLAPRSASLAALKIALQGAEEGGAETQLFDLRILNLPFYIPGAPVPESARIFLQAAHEANGLIWSSPLYQGTVSGAFKNALDWLHLLEDRQPAFLTNKIVGLISTAGGAMGLQAVNTMEFSVRALRAWAVPMVMPIARATSAFDANGNATDPRIAEQLKSIGREVVRASRQFATEGYCDYSDGRVDGQAPVLTRQQA